MLTESQFREIADSLRDIVTELKKMKRSKNPEVVYHVGNSHEVDIKRRLADLGYYQMNKHNFERSDHSGPSIA